MDVQNNNINNLFHNKPVNSPIQHNRATVIAKGDSAASHNYWREEDMHCLANIEPANPCQIMLLNADSIHPSNRGQLPLSNKLSKAAKDAIIVPKLKSSSLISLGQLCDDGCKVILDHKKLKVIKNNDFVIEGQRNHSDGLWDIPIHSSYVMPQRHPGLYSKKNKKQYKCHNTQKTNKSKPVTIPA